MSAEDRLHPRFRVTARADVLGTEVMLAREIADISVGGCRFSGRAWESRGSKVEMVLFFPTIDEVLPVRGMVVRTSSQDMGIRFEDLSEQQKWALRKHLRDLESSDPAA